jgi:hypothetical protein
LQSRAEPEIDLNKLDQAGLTAAVKEARNHTLSHRTILCTLLIELKLSEIEDEQERLNL